MSLYCKKYNYIFIHNPKCAGTTMSLLLERSGSRKGAGHKSIQEYKNEGIDIDSIYKWGFVRNPYDRTLSAYKYHLGFIDKFVSMGSPLSSLSTFEDYVLNIQKNMPGALHEPRGTQHLQHQHKYLCIDRENTLEFVGRYENLENDWSYICNTLFKNTVNIRGETNNVGSLEAAATHGTEELLRRLPIKNQSANNYLKYYSPQMIQVVNEVYAQDFEIFEYEIEKQ